MPEAGSKVTAADVLMVSGGVPNVVRALARAIEKHAEWAAPKSSSGVVTESEPSERAFQLTGSSAACDDCRLTVPLPETSTPFQTVEDVLVTGMRRPSMRGGDVFSLRRVRRFRTGVRDAWPGAGHASLGSVSEAANPFGQVLVALVTPFTPDGEVDWNDVEKHIDDVIAAGADGIVVTGTTGETSTLTDSEKIRLVEVAKQVASGRAKIITGGGSNETAHAMQLAKQSAKAGADGNMIVTPYYNKPTQAGILTHFRMIADATDLPVILYDIPGRTGVPIRYETILRAAKHPNILAIKDAKGDFSEVSRVLNQTDLLYFSGDDANVLPHLSIGASGLIGVTANITATPYRQIVDAVNAGDLKTATAAHKKLEPLVRAIMTHVPGTVAAKYVLHGLGRIGSPRVRLPLVGPEESEAALIEDEIALVHDVPGVDFSNFRPDRNAAAGGALPKIAGTTR